MRKGTFQISYCGNQALVGERCAQLLKVLTEEPFSWKPPGSGYPSKISLALKFVPFSKEELSSLQSFKKPIIHIYWLCSLDVEMYKANEREQLVSWFASLRDANIFDWFIVYDTSVPGPTKQRQLVFERIKSDFSKFSDKLVELDVSGGKWTSLLVPLREKIHQTITEVVSAQQNRIHLEKDKYMEEGWHFYNFAVLQFEIASIFSGMELHDEVLAQLDELDALLSLLISNAVALRAEAYPLWLIKICAQTSSVAPCFLWFYEIRGDSFHQRLVSRQATYLDMRTYLFCCQVSTLFAQYRRKHQSRKEVKGGITSEEEFCSLVLQYGHTFMTTVIQEMVHLKINLTNSRRCAYIALMTLEIIALAKKLMPVPNSQTFICNLHILLVTKIKQLGEATGLYYNETEDSKNVSLEDTLSWVPNYELAVNDPESLESPVSSLRSMLSSKETYAQAFVKFYESSVAVMKHFKRFRQAVLLNVQLADFYLARGRDNLTVDQWSTCLLSWQKLADLYETEQWKQLYFGLIKRIVDYFDQTSRAYLKFTSAICSFANFSAETRLYYWQKLSNSMNSLDEASDARLDQSTFCHPFTIEFLNFREIISVPHMSLHHFDLKLKSVFPSAITVKNIKVRFGIMRKPNSNQQQEYSNEVVYRNEEILELQPGCDTQLTVYSDKITVIGDFQLVEVQISVNKCTFVVAQNDFSTLHIEEEKAEIMLKTTEDILFTGIPTRFLLSLFCGTEIVDKNTHAIVGSSNKKFLFSDSPASCAQETLSIDVVFDGNKSFNAQFLGICPIEDQSSSDLMDRQVVITWRDRTETFLLSFRNPFKLESSLRIIGKKFWIFLTMENWDPTAKLLIHSLQQDVISIPDIKLTFPCEELFKESQMISQNYAFAWMIENLESLTDDLECRLSIRFSINGSDVQRYDRQITYPGPKKRLRLICSIDNSSGSVCRVDTMCRLTVSVQLMAAYYEGDVMLEITFDESWYIPEKLALLSFDSKGSAKFETSIVPKCVGYLPFPAAKLWLLNSTDMGMSRNKTEIPSGCVDQPSRGRQIHVLQALKQLPITPKHQPLMLE